MLPSSARTENEEGSTKQNKRKEKSPEVMGDKWEQQIYRKVRKQREKRGLSGNKMQSYILNE